MPATRSTRSIRRKAATRTILGTLDENESASAAAAAPATDGTMTGKLPTGAAPSSNDDAAAGGGGSSSDNDALQLPSDFDGSDAATVRLLLEDISREVKKRQDSIALLADQAKSEQQEATFVHKMKIPRSVRSMTVKDFNGKFGCDILAEVRRAVSEEGGLPPSAVAAAAAGKKRDRPGGKTAGPKGAGAMDLETPMPKGQGGMAGHAPGTALRTVRRGEAIFSANGSPVDKAEEGGLVATVCKKARKGNSGGGGSKDRAAIFDINVGDGRYVNLSDPSTVQHLDQDMKNTAMSQLKILQDQMASLMAQLGN